MKKFLGYLALYTGIICISFQSLLTHISSHLYDWLDYPFIVWTMFQNIQKIKTLNFTHFFDTNSFYPHKATLLFSDILLPQTLIALPFTFFVSNPILVFNIVFFITLILNFTAAYALWSKLFKKERTAFFGALLISFSPFVFMYLAHFQMISFWPFLFCFYFVLKNREDNSFTHTALAGIFLSIQFLASVYLSIFLIAALVLFYSLECIYQKNKWLSVKNVTLIFFTFLICAGPFVKGYIDIKKEYNIQRNIEEYIRYSAHITDYLFSKGITSLLYNFPLFTKWNTVNKHTMGELAAFPGFLLSVLAFFGLFYFGKIKKLIRISIDLDQLNLFFLLLLSSGFIFSLGPRLNVNGVYIHIPTPYALVQKIIPFMDIIRAPARWSFLFYFGMIFFALTIIEKISQSRRLILMGICIFFVFEYIPFKIQTHTEKYINKDYTIIKNICQTQKEVLLEIPVTHLYTSGEVGNGLNYIAKLELASLYHGCLLVNGYSGYDLQDLKDLDLKMQNYISHGDNVSIIREMKNRNVKLIKINQDKMNMKSRSIDGLIKLSESVYEIQ